MRKGIGAVLVVGGVLLGAAVPSGAQPLRQDLGSYLVLAVRSLRLKNTAVDGTCNVGVDCAAPSNGSGACGSIRTQAVTFTNGAQLVGDEVFFTLRGAQVYQLFRNGGGALGNVTIADPPVQPFTPPVIPGTCGSDCALDVTAIEQLCGFPDPFPACDAGQPVTVLAGQDCAGDVSPGNGRCDLPPGVYGALSVRSHAALALGAGTYVFCSVRAARSTNVSGGGTTILVPGGGSMSVSNDSTFGEACGDLTVLVDGRGAVRFGHALSVTARLCAPEAKVRLGHGNHLRGQFVADFITSDRGNDGSCCGGATTTTLAGPTTSTLASTSTSSSLAPSTSSTTTSTSSTTSTTTTTSTSSSSSSTTSTTSTTTTTQDTSTTTTTEPAVAICGNGVVEPPEDCDPPGSSCHCPSDPPDPGQWTGTCSSACFCAFCGS